MLLKACPRHGPYQPGNPPIPRGRCPECNRERNQARRSTSARGYGTSHQKLRKMWTPQVAAGLVACARCGQPIAPGDPWDLGHSDEDRRTYTGPEHRACNRGTAGRTKERMSRRW
jgi:hypothetical protein